MTYRLDNRLVHELDSAEVDYTLERRSKHYRLLINGQTVLVLPTSPKDKGRYIDNSVAALRRFLKRNGYVS